MIEGNLPQAGLPLLLQAIWIGPILLLLYTCVSEGRFGRLVSCRDHPRVPNIVFEIPLQRLAVLKTILSISTPMGANLNALNRLFCCPNVPFAIMDALNCVVVVLFLLTLFVL